MKAVRHSFLVVVDGSIAIYRLKSMIIELIIDSVEVEPSFDATDTAVRKLVELGVLTRNRLTLDGRIDNTRKDFRLTTIVSESKVNINILK